MSQQHAHVLLAVKAVGLIFREVIEEQFASYMRKVNLIAAQIL